MLLTGKGDKLCTGYSIIIHQNTRLRGKYGSKSDSYMRPTKQFWFIVIKGESGFPNRGYIK